MRKIDVYAIIALTMSSLLLLPAFSSSSSASNFTVSVSGVIRYPSLDPSTPVSTGIVAYGIVSSSQVNFIADNFGFVDTGWQYPNEATTITDVQQIKARNPSIKVIGYKDLIGMDVYLDDWSVANSHEDWFVHDASGSRIFNTAMEWYLMDVGNAGWRQHWVEYVNSKLTSYPQYDGVFADDTWYWLDDAINRFDHTIPSSVLSRWHADTRGMLQYVKTNLLSNKVLIINSEDGWLNNGTIDYLNYVDGQMIESLGHPCWVGSDWYYDSDTLIRQLNVLATGASTGKIIWAESGTAADSGFDRMVKYCYALFLLGFSSNSAFWGWNTGGTYNKANRADAYQSIMGTNIGAPTGAYYSSQSVYMRDFTSGKVLFNPSSNSHTVSLGGNYRLLDGTIVSSIALAPRSAEILLSPA